MKLSKAKETKEETLRIRLTTHYKQKLRNYAARHGKTESEIIREYIRRLPDKKPPKETSPSEN